MFEADDIERFWRQVVVRGPNDCWEWQGTTNTRGYGQFGIAGKRWVASRLSLTIALGRPIADGMLCCHRCDNPPCVNPAHLWEGTDKDNAQDASRKRRSINARKTHCSRGHPFAGSNLRLKVRGGVTERVCRTCGSIWKKQRRERKCQRI